MQPAKFNIFQSGISVKDAVELILKQRESANPFDIIASGGHMNCEGNLVAQAVDGDKKTYTLTLAGEGMPSLFKCLGVDTNLLARVSADTAISIASDLLEKQRGFVVRAAVHEGREYVRTIAPSRTAMADDAALFGKFLSIAKADKWEEVPVDGVWVSDIGSAIRVCIGHLPESSKKFNHELSYGFDIVNSEVVPGSTWVKGVILGEDFAVVAPAILGVKNTNKFSECFGWLKHYMEQSASKVDAMAAAGLPVCELDADGELGNLVRKQLLSRMEKNIIYTIMPIERNVMPAFNLIRMVGKYAASLDYYHRRSQVEYISNIWLKNVKK